MDKLSPSSLFFSAKQGDLLQAIHTDQATYMIVAPEEVEQIISATAFPKEVLLQLISKGSQVKIIVILCVVKSLITN